MLICLFYSAVLPSADDVHGFTFRWTSLLIPQFCSLMPTLADCPCLQISMDLPTKLRISMWSPSGLVWTSRLIRPLQFSMDLPANLLILTYRAWLFAKSGRSGLRFSMDLQTHVHILSSPRVLPACGGSSLLRRMSLLLCSLSFRYARAVAARALAFRWMSLPVC